MLKILENLDTLYCKNRNQWRDWLGGNYQLKKEIWLVFPNKSTGKVHVSYNDAVEEALCFGWIDSIIRKLNENHAIQRFTPRRNNSSYSQPNIERLRWLSKEKMLLPEIDEKVKHLLRNEFVYPADILEFMRSDDEVWKNFMNFSEPYKRIRVTYIDDARKRPGEFEKRLNNFFRKTRENKKIVGHGGVDKYY